MILIQHGIGASHLNSYSEHDRSVKKIPPHREKHFSWKQTLRESHITCDCIFISLCISYFWKIREKMKQQLLSVLHCYARQGKQLFYRNTDCSGRKLWTLQFSHSTQFPGIKHLCYRNLIVWLSRGKISLTGVLEGVQISSVTENPSVLPLQTSKHQMVQLFQGCQLKYPFLAWKMLRKESFRNRDEKTSPCLLQKLSLHALPLAASSAARLGTHLFFFPLDVWALAPCSRFTLKGVRGNEWCFSSSSSAGSRGWHAMNSQQCCSKGAC